MVNDGEGLQFRESFTPSSHNGKLSMPLGSGPDPAVVCECHIYRLPLTIYHFPSSKLFRVVLSQLSLLFLQLLDKFASSSLLFLYLSLAKLFHWCIRFFFISRANDPGRGNYQARVSLTPALSGDAWHPSACLGRQVLVW